MLGYAMAQKAEDQAAALNHGWNVIYTDQSNSLSFQWSAR